MMRYIYPKRNPFVNFCFLVAFDMKYTHFFLNNIWQLHRHSHNSHKHQIKQRQNHTHTLQHRSHRARCLRYRLPRHTALHQSHRGHQTHPLRRFHTRGRRTMQCHTRNIPTAGIDACQCSAAAWCHSGHARWSLSSIWICGTRFKDIYGSTTTEWRYTGTDWVGETHGAEFYETDIEWGGVLSYASSAASRFEAS